MKDYVGIPFEQIITTLTSGRSGIRMSGETIQFATALAIDNKLPVEKNLSTFERLLKRLLQFKCIDTLRLLLNYISKDSGAYAIKNLSSYFVPTFDSIFNELRLEEATHPSSYRNLVYFMTMCPIVKKEGYRSVVQTLNNEDMSRAARLLCAISNASHESTTAESSDKDIYVDEGLKEISEFLRNQTVAETLVDVDDSCEE